MNTNIEPQDFNLIEKTNYFASKVFPYASKQHARRMLTTFCLNHPDLLDKLHKSGWNVSEIFMTRQQIRLILNYLKQ